MPRYRATFDKNGVPPLTRGDFRGFGAVTDNLVWVVDPETHPRRCATPPTEEIFRGGKRR